MRVLTVFVPLFLCSFQVQADLPTKQYDMGFETVAVFEYIKSLRDANEAVPIFPPRTSNAVIVRTVAENSRASMAGLQANDLIRIINGSHLRSPNAADQKLSSITSQDELKLGVIRRVDNRWDQVTIVMPAISDKTALKLNLKKAPAFDAELHPFVKVRHRKAPSTNYAPNNFQIYYTETNSLPDQLCLKIAQLLPGETETGHFIITTDTGRYVFEAEVPSEGSNRVGIFRSTRSPDWEPVRLELLILFSEGALEGIKEEFRVAEEAYKSEFEDFKFDRNRTDKAYLEQNQRRLSQITALERINARLMRVEKNHQRLLQRQVQMANPRSITGINKTKLSNKARKAIKDRFKVLTTEQQELVRKVYVSQMSTAFLKEAELLELEETGFAERAIKRKRVSQGWRWCDISLNSEQLKIVKEIIAAKKVTVHYESTPAQKFELTPEQQEQMQLVLTVFKDEGGKVK